MFGDSSVKADSKLLLVPVLLFAVLMSVCEGSGPNADGSKYREVERLWAQLPRYPDSVETFKTGKNEPWVASSSKNFDSGASYDELREIYKAKLLGDGWQIERDESATGWLNRETRQRLYFSRDEYMINIEYSGP
jgi:hypothetical protein